MKNYLLFLILVFTGNVSIGQLKIFPGTHWINSGNAVIVLQDIDLINDGTILAGSSLTKFTGTVNTVISGTAVSNFNDLEMAKTGGTQLVLEKNITVGKSVIFNSGLLELNKHELSLAADGFLFNESESSRITGISGGEVSITANLSSPSGSNPGNLGAVVTSAANLGNVVIKRGHQIQSGTGLSASIQRYFTITPTNNTALNATFRCYYFDAELNNQSELSLKLFRSTDAGLTWTNQNSSSRNSIQNYVELSGINAFSRWTLSSSGSVLPVSGLDFQAKRISNSTVQLNWKTNQEMNNRGFYVERKKENENDFSTIGFSASLASGGNSNLPLNYLKTDLNDFRGKTFYRLKQEDMDGKFVYSVIRFVSGTADNTAGFKVWPVPSNGDVFMTLQDIEKAQLQVFDMEGRLVQQMPVSGNTRQVISGLVKGTYVVKLAGYKDLFQKIIIQ